MRVTLGIIIQPKIGTLMSVKQEYLKKNKNAFKEYEEQLKNGTARQITHYTEEQLKKMLEKEEHAQKDPLYTPDPFIQMIKSGLIQNCTPDQFEKIIEIGGNTTKELGEKWLKDIEETSKRAGAIYAFREKNPNVTWAEIMQKFSSPQTLEELRSEMERQAQIFELLWQNRNSLEDINDLPGKFFKTIGEDEFGISRLIADPLNNVPKMLEDFSKPRCIKKEQGYTVYQIESKTENSLGDTLRLTHRYRALNEEDANNRAQAFVRRITGKQKKVFEACWAMANQKMRHTYTCSLTELMLLAYPARKDGSPFTVHDRVEFYQDLLDLTETRLTVEKKEKPGKKKREIATFILPFITIHKMIEDDFINRGKESDRYPNQISISVLHNPLYESERLYSVGAGIKWKTLELSHDDMQLAEWIQVRKSQSMKEKYITFTNRKELLRLAKLDGIKHSGMANKKLLLKLERLKEKGIIKDYPKMVADVMRIKIR